MKQWPHGGHDGPVLLRLAAAPGRAEGDLRAAGRCSDCLPGFTLSELAITNPAVVAVSGSDRHPAVRPTGDPGDEVAATVFTVTWSELAAADEYEVPPYARLWVGLGSGQRAWVYVDQPQAPAPLGGEPGADLPEFDEPWARLDNPEPAAVAPSTCGQAPPGALISG